MRIVAGTWRGRTLVVPAGQGTRPTADRVRQALFDMLMHAEWGGRSAIEGATVLDVFAGTGALGLEALSRGAASVCFIEQDATALKAIRANVAACRAEGQAEVIAGDALRCPAAARSKFAERWSEEVTSSTASVVFLDPPYANGLVPRAVARLREVGRVAAGALIVAETGRGETWIPEEPVLAERHHGAARVLIYRVA